ncbi:GAF domain-containing protein [Microbacterium sp. CFBP 13617]|uniref:GAF domain-containing protein n=1 Tax=Microbacterium sp. CFBP 13617 TaxID=2774035 RepID=UPI00177BE5FD|nr:GAF domain-containing protein [Microbacterium sp. CFBP 13617]MBD8219257.1 GAF domain-containing protein [Microbacterium sp. CFBP 13617]
MSKRRGGMVWTVISAAVPVVGSFVGAQLIAWALRDTTGIHGLLWAGGLACVAAAVGVTIAVKVIEHRRGTSIEKAKRNQLVKLRDELMPFASTAADMARQPHSVRAAYLKNAAQAAATALRSIVGDRGAARPRAVVYLLNADNNPVSMDSIAHGGRGERPGPFIAGTARGDAALSFIDKKAVAFYPDLPKKRPSGYDGTMSGYDTFIAAPIWTDTGVYGMVTLDAPKAHSFDDGDVALVELIAEMMSIPFEVGQDGDVRTSI